MTKINQAEYDQLQTLDQALIWSIVTLAKANRSPDNIALDGNSYASIRPEAIDLVNCKFMLDGDGEPFFSFSATFPLLDNNPLDSSPSIVSKIPNYTDYQPLPEPLSLPTNSPGFPRPDIPPTIDTLERLVCWLGLIAYQLGDFIKYCNLLQRRQATDSPIYMIDSRGLTYEKSQPVSAIGSLSGSGSASTTAEDLFLDLSPIYKLSPNNEDLADKINTAREDAASQEPPQTNPGKGYDRIDTLPVCADQDPNVKAYSRSLKEILK
jgi:hypothetical protein